MTITVFNEMIGKVFDSVKVYHEDVPEHIRSYLDNTCLYFRYETLVFSSKDLIAAFFHCQDCCESVTIKDIVGDLSDLEGSPIVEAEVTIDFKWNQEMAESETYSFYKFRTQKGFVTVTWLGNSNGCYSETVRVEFFNPEDIHNMSTN